ncbi:hypothetical protein [Paenibacillus glufosinatiresistens]|uniref:hypothetical protein n=1 Tax=Paenibacillus glufosinatiresistens TaxID=3070657 RepID=UPI00286E5A11|nr:hypothetical protein [Paenibacillus sp. YX.27]
MTQQAYTALKQMSPEERARVLGEKAGELAVDALLTKGAGALGKEALNATLETAGTLAQKAGELLPKPGAVLTTPEGIRIPVSETEADWVQKIEGGVEQEILDSLPKDWKYTENNGFVHIRDANGNVRMKIDPPDKVTKYDHVHLFDESGNPIDVNLNVVDRKSPDAHIPYKK